MNAKQMEKIMEKDEEGWVQVRNSRNNKRKASDNNKKGAPNKVETKNNVSEAKSKAATTMNQVYASTMEIS